MKPEEENPNLAYDCRPAVEASRASSAAAQANSAQDQQSAMMRKLKAVLDRFEITIAEANDLVVLQDYDIVVICDDSGSMLNNSLPPEQRVLGAPVRTRWDELKETVGEMVEIATCFNDQGIPVHFLNRESVKVQHATDQSFVQAFQNPPRGRTPLTQTLERVASQLSGENPILLFVFTDGEPNEGPEPFKQGLRRLISRMRIRVQIMACTANEEEIEWLNDFDAQLKEVDVTDDYHSERKEVLHAGRAAKFTRGDWCMKAMLGPVSHKFDAWDEKSPFAAEVAMPGTQCGGCALM